MEFADARRVQELQIEMLIGLSVHDRPRVISHPAQGDDNVGVIVKVGGLMNDIEQLNARCNDAKFFERLALGGANIQLARLHLAKWYRPEAISGVPEKQQPILIIGDQQRNRVRPPAASISNINHGQSRHWR